jgi:Family of unknown function (DUF6232)
MVVFYRGNNLFITHEVFEARQPEVRSFGIRELTGIHVVQDGQDRALPGTVVIGSAAAVVAFVAMKGHIAGASMWAVLMLAAVVSSTISWGCMRGGGRSYELRATYHGRSVCLLRTGDERMLGQVMRALRRAVEWNFQQ